MTYLALVQIYLAVVVAATLTKLANLMTHVIAVAEVAEVVLVEVAEAVLVEAVEVAVAQVVLVEVAQVVLVEMVVVVAEVVCPSKVSLLKQRCHYPTSF